MLYFFLYFYVKLLVHFYFNNMKKFPEQKATTALGEMAVDVVDPNRPEEPKDKEQAQV